MRHRKKLLFAALLLMAAYVTWCFWPHSNPQAVRALATLRDLVVQRQDKSQPAVDPPDKTQVEVSLIVAKLNVTDATTGLFAKRADGPLFTCGYIGDERKMRDIVSELQSLGVLEIVSQPVMQMLSGQRGSMRSGSQVPVMLPAAAPAAGASPPTLGWQIDRTELDISPEIRADGVIRLRLDCGVTWVGGRRERATPKAIVTLHTGQSQTSVLGNIKPGETLIVGLANKWDAPATFRMPLLSELPGVGPWLCFERQREIEEELIILATPRIVTSVAAK